MNKKKLGLSLSGGGYRAAAYHLGTMRALKNFRILEEVDVLSTISGGSIIGAYYCVTQKEQKTFDEFFDSLKDKLHKKDVIKNVLVSWSFIRTVLVALLFLVPATYFLFTDYAWISPILVALLLVILLKFQFNLFPVSKTIERIFDKFFYSETQLGCFPDKPVIVIGTTNLNTSRLFTFSRDWMQDSTYQYRKVTMEDGKEIDAPIEFISTHFPVSRAVIASSCVPFAFTPIQIDKKFYKNPDDYGLVDPQLVDGGVFDNQGIHKIMQKGWYACEYQIVSDAGNKVSSSRFANTIALLIRTVDVFMARIKNVQMVQGIYTENTIDKEIAYISLSWDAGKCIPGFVRNMISGNVPERVMDAHKLKDEWVKDPEKYGKEIEEYLAEQIGYENIPKPLPGILKIARDVGTNLTALSEEQINALIAQSECITEIQIRLYCPSLVPPELRKKPAPSTN